MPKPRLASHGVVRRDGLVVDLDRLVVLLREHLIVLEHLRPLRDEVRRGRSVKDGNAGSHGVADHEEGSQSAKALFHTTSLKGLLAAQLIPAAFLVKAVAIGLVPTGV